VDHIPDIASSLLLQQNQEKIKSGLVNLHTELQDIKFKLSEYLKEVNGNLDNILDAINEFKNKLLKRIEEIAKSSILEVTTRHEAIAHGLKFDMDKLDRMQEDVKKYISKLERDSFHDDTEHFVTVKLAEYNTAKVTECASELLWEPSKRLIFKRNSIFDKCLEESSLGELNGNAGYKVHALYTY
jgi:ACT domain-containing protein